MLPKKLVFIDVETTGPRPTYDRIIEVGILRVENGNVVKEYKQLINPHIYLSPFIQLLTGISQNDLEEAPSFSDVRDELIEILDDATFVAHNVRFDYSFIRNEFKRFGIPFRAQQLCTVKLSRLLYPNFRKHDLSSLIERHGFACENRHRAFDDAYVLWQFFQKILEEFNEKKIKNAFHLIQKRPTFPKHIDPEVIDEIPETFGVYKFYDSSGSLLYIGKSKNIHTRILSHFSSDGSSTKQFNMVEKIAHIDYIPTAGELGALLRESYLIKKLRPVYNRALRIQNQAVTLVKTTDDNGYDTVKYEDIKNIPINEVDSIMGTFKSKRKAEEFLSVLAKKHVLCEKILGLNSSAPCFAYKLKMCKGACIGRESAKIYNLRFLLAFSENKIKPWYFGQPIEIIEKNPFLGLYEKFVIDKWCLLSNVTSDNQNGLGTDFEMEFDIDVYNILARFLRKSIDSRISTLRASQNRKHEYQYEYEMEF